MATLFTSPFLPAFNTLGGLAPGAKLYFFLTGTTTPATVYADAGLTTPLAHPVVANAGGAFVSIYLDPAVTYRVQLKTATNGLIDDADPITTDSTAVSAGGVSYTAPGGTAQTVQTKLQQVVHIKDFGGVPDAVVTTGGAATGTNSAPAAIAAIAYLTARGGGTLVIEGGDYLANAAVVCGSDITIHIDGNATWYFDGPIPTAPKGHYKASAFAFVGTETDADYVTYSGATGDYFISAPRAFAAGTTLQAGDSSFTASADMSAILSAGSWIHLCSGQAGWHALVSEYAQVASVAGPLVTLTEPLRYNYSNATNSLADFCAKHKRPKRPPGNVPIETWAIAGFRRVQPVFNSHITGNGRICGLRDHTANGYSDFAAFFWCAIGCSVGAVQVTGNSVWGLDCQEFVFNDTKFGPTYATSSHSGPALLMNGTNRLAINSPRANGYTFALEEYIADFTIIDPSMAGGVLSIAAGCRDGIVVGGSAVSNAAPALSMGQNNLEFGTPNIIIDKLNVFSQGAGAVLYTQRLLQAHPSVSPAMIANVNKYYDGSLNVLRDCQLVSTLNPGLDLELKNQSLRADNVTLGIASNAGITGVVTHVIGGPLSARKAVDGVRVGVRSAATLPTFAADYQGQDVINSGGGEGWTCTRLVRDTVAAHVSTTIVQVGTIANYAVGDVVTVLIANGTFVSNQSAVTVAASNLVTVGSTAGFVAGMAVTGENIPVGTTVLNPTVSATQFTMTANAEYSLDAATAAMVTVGNIVQEHTAVVTAVNTGASQITIGTAMPAGYTAVTATGNYIEQTRWSGPIEGSAVYDPGNLVDGAGVTTTVTVTGAVLGDLVNVSFSLDLQGISLTAYVSAANTVSVRFQNETGGALDLASGTLRCRIVR